MGQQPDRTPSGRGRLWRAAKSRSPRVRVLVDGVSLEAQTGQSLLTLLLERQGAVRSSEFGDGPRAGFCLMGACQDCWIWLSEGQRARACTTPVTDGMIVLTRPPDGFPAAADD